MHACLAYAPNTRTPALQTPLHACMDRPLPPRYVLSCERDLPGAPRGSGGHYPVMMPLPGQAQQEGGEALVHWCHGAPGAVFLLSKAHEVKVGRG